MTNPDAAPEDEFGMDAVGAVAAVGRGVDLTDHVGQPHACRTARADGGRKRHA